MTDDQLCPGLAALFLGSLEEELGGALDGSFKLGAGPDAADVLGEVRRRAAALPLLDAAALLGEHQDEEPLLQFDLPICPGLVLGGGWPVSAATRRP